MGMYRGFRPFDDYGNRTYLTSDERKAFMEAAMKAEPEVKTFCSVLAYTGARISEVRAITPKSVDFALQCIIFRSLKKRGRVVYRAVPMPETVLTMLDQVHVLKTDNLQYNRRLWPWCRTTAWSRVSGVMDDAGLSGIRATSRGLRHTFAVSAIKGGVALNMVQKWMGHEDIETTALYANAMGKEELSIAQKLWNGFDPI